ncbi:hypothetical protein [Conexibacter sp. SYSU D00693]|uniref:hypothetical protein n=1 Tax=Conexibacter sp. SYSU D00693 TaxID=2812560 RepID=UPI00196A2EFC|nr:hypothetical protein [Conexibacter sp. SYSU D00693]
MAKTQRERDDEARKAKLDRIEEQVENGSLTIRTMSEEERQRWARKREEKATELTPAEQRKAASAERRRSRRAARAAEG